MNILLQLKAALLGIIQGLTEFLPVSSSGHLIIVQHLIHFKNNPIIFDVFLHLGTLFAILIFYNKDILALFKNFKYSAYIVLATIPAVIVGFSLHNQIEAIFDNAPLLIGFAYMITAAWLYLGYKKIKTESNASPLITPNSAILIGIAQAVAITPGISRSGATIIAAILLGIERKEAAKFSFLLSIPAILGAVVLEGTKISTANIDIIPLLIGTVTSFVSGYIAIKILLNTLIKGKLNLFSYYCLGLGIIIILFFR